MTEPAKKPYSFDDVQDGEELGSFDYVLGEAQVDNYRESMDDPEAAFTTLAVKHDVACLGLVYDRASGINARNEVHFFNPPIPGKKITVTGRIVEHYVRLDLPYLVVEATAVDEDGRIIERIKTYLMQRGERVGEKWAQQQR